MFLLHTKLLDISIVRFPSNSKAIFLYVSFNIFGICFFFRRRRRGSSLTSLLFISTLCRQSTPTNFFPTIAQNVTHTLMEWIYVRFLSMLIKLNSQWNIQCVRKSFWMAKFHEFIFWKRKGKIGAITQACERNRNEMNILGYQLACTRIFDLYSGFAWFRCNFKLWMTNLLGFFSFHFKRECFVMCVNAFTHTQMDTQWKSLKSKLKWLQAIHLIWSMKHELMSLFEKNYPKFNFAWIWWWLMHSKLPLAWLFSVCLIRSGHMGCHIIVIWWIFFTLIR